ncbi:MAG: hypothetical protein IKB88_02220 [Clostridia bacterium]|nr:hypothetical protein [Clostridia bacterium]
MDFRVDFTSDNILPDGNNFGQVGEHNAAILVITPPKEMTDNAEILYFCLACEVGREYIKSVVRSELYEKAETIRVPLWQQATISETAKLQLEGYDGNNNVIIKSKLVAYNLNPSANGLQVERDINGGSLAGSVAKLSKEIAEMNEQRPQMVDGVVDYTEIAMFTTDPTLVVIETSLLPENARVKKIEIPDIMNQTNEYVSLEDVIAKDTENGYSSPYYIMYPKNMIGNFFTTAAIVVFSAMSTNSFYTTVEANLFMDQKIKIYYEIEEN